MLYGLVLICLELIGFTAFLYTALRFLQIYREIGGDELALAFLSFMFLSLSQLCVLLSILSSDIRIATALYVATATTAIASFTIMILQRHIENKMYIMMPTILLILVPDIVAGLLSSYVAIEAKRSIRLFLLMLSLSYYLRALAVVASVEFTPILLLISESVRSTSAVALAVHNSLKVSRLWAESEVGLR
ncbi:MAG: hypothetical protein QXG46_02530 [Ignisphaera sp.]